MNVAFYTLGCKLNQCETEALASFFHAQGFSVSDIHRPAELYIINTCTVTSKSEQKARRVIRKLAAENPGSLVVVTGCYAQLAKEALAALAPNLVVIPQATKHELFNLSRQLGAFPAFFTLPTDEKQRWLEEQTLAGEDNSDPFAFKVEQFQFHSRAFCKIQDGCDNHCTYCRVPLARGSGVSLALPEVLRRVCELEQAGYREVVLTGVNICAYNSGGAGLTALLHQLLTETSLIRIRLSSLEPEKITQELVGCLAEPRICPHFHLPIQSGSDVILGRMKRRYRVAVVRQAVSRLKQARPGAFLAADVIVGFPGETAEDYRQTRVLLEELELAGLHIFPFSPRPGTAACGYKPPVPESVRKTRATDLKQLGELLFTRYLAGMRNQEVSLLLEQEIEQEGQLFWQGLSENYLKVQVTAPATTFCKGTLLSARITVPGAICQGEALLII